MTKYAHMWSGSTAVLTTIGVSVALAAWPASQVVGTFCFAAVIVGGMAMVRRSEQVRLSWRRVLVAAVAGGLAVVAAIGLSVILGSAAVLLMGAVAATSPVVLAIARNWLPAARRHGSSDVSIEDGVPSVQLPGEAAGSSSPAECLDDASLCQAWCRSYARLQRASSPQAQLREVEARQSYLDELERRHPGGLSAWLSSGAHPAGDPYPHLVPGDGPDQPPAA